MFCEGWRNSAEQAPGNKHLGTANKETFSREMNYILIQKKKMEEENTR